ncbi:unnamed protein product [Tilletia caries]|nr:unnamed protein product [Tilletia caries]
MKGSHLYRYLAPLLLLLPIPGPVVQGCVHELDKAQLIEWQLTNSNGSIDIPSHTSARSVHLDLLHAGLIPRPDVGLNEGEVRWVAQEEYWSYTADLRPLIETHHQGAGAGAGVQHLLHFPSIDTRATVFLSKDGILDPSIHPSSSFETNNAHRRYTFDLTSPLQTEPVLTVRLHSPVEYARQESENEPVFPTQNEVPDAPASQQYEYPHRNFIRKGSSDFGWDWGPAYADSGFRGALLIRLGDCPPGRGPSLELSPTLSRFATSSSFFLVDTALDVQRHDDLWRLNVSLSLFSSRSLPVPVPQTSLHIAIEGTEVHCLTRLGGQIEPGMNDDGRLWAQCDVPSSAVELWWPHSIRLPNKQLARQRLYNLTFTLNIDSTDEEGEEVLSWRVRTGFRTIQLDQHVYTADEVVSGIHPGSAFHFKMNDSPLPLPILGSNLIPFSPFAFSQSEDEQARTIQYTIDALLASGQNMVRVWGGGRYASDRLYETAEEVGILVWSEFAFACSLYPTYPTFLENVKVEADQQVRRISRFASHALWAGNNEGELNMLPVSTTYPNGSIYETQYELLFNDLLRSITRANHASSDYIPSSTTTGGSFPAGLGGRYVPRYRDFGAGEIHGDGEHYGYDARTALDAGTYPRSRFVNEFGMHSMADIHSFDKIATAKADYAFNSTIARSRNKHSPPGNLTYPWPANDGQAQMTQAISLHFPIPQRKQLDDSRNKAELGDRSLLAQWIYSTQCFQALYVGNQIGFYRLRTDAAERNTGSLYWQLNSVWTAATDWASLEVDGRWKTLHYVVARMHAENIAYVHHNMSRDVVEVYAISRAWINSSIEADLTWYDWEGNLVDKLHRTGVQLGPMKSTKLAEFDLRNTSSRYAGNWLHVRLTSSSTSTVRNEQFFSSISLGLAPLRRSKLVIQAVSKVKNDDNQRLARGELQRYFGRPDDDDATPASRTTLPFEISNAGKGVAPWVVLTHSERLRGWFVDDRGEPSNAIWLRPGERRAMRFRCYGACLEAAEVGRDISALSVWDNVEVPP